LADGAAELPYRQRIEREFQNDVDQAQREQDAEAGGTNSAAARSGRA
jgi:hypothetical protein